MSLVTAVETLQTSLKAITEFDDPILGIPDEADKGVSKQLFIGGPTELFEYEDLLAAEGPTSSLAEVSIVMTFHQDDVTPEDRTLFKYMQDKVKDVRTIIQTGNTPGTGAFKSDGDVGFRAQVSSVEYSFRPNDPRSAVLMIIVVQAYTKD